MGNESIKNSITDLKRLALELAMNHINVSSYDLFKESKDMLKVFYDNHLKGSILNSSSEIVRELGNEVLTNKSTRNVLVIGAGATNNAFSDIPLATKAYKDILESIVVSRVTQSNKDAENLSLHYLLEYYRWKTFGSDHPQPDFLKKSHLNDFLETQIFTSRDNSEEDEDDLEVSLLERIAEKYFSELRRFNLVKHDYSNDPKKIDFETVLTILSKILPASTIRASIQKIYKIKDGPTLFYHVVAHLFKHRFIDVIINFNFDELLDEILLEELSSDAFDTILSDGDCRPINELMENDRLRQPLYIKPHGTATHKSTLRFTKDQYHDIPDDLRVLITDLLRSDLPILETKKSINLINVGFGLMSMEFNEILASTLNNESTIYSFNWSEKKLADDEQSQFDKIFSHFDKDHRPNHRNIYHANLGEELKKQHPTKIDRIPINLLESLDISFCYLYSNIRDVFNPPFEPRDITRHLIIVLFFGNKEFWDSDITNGRSVYPKAYFKSASYFLDRTIIEIMISATLTQGKVDPYLLISGKAGRYYAQYYEITKINDPLNIIPFNSLLDGLDLFPRQESEKLNYRILHIDETNRGRDVEATFYSVFEFFMGIREPFSDKMKSHLDFINHKDNSELKKHLRSLFEGLFYVDNSKIQSSVRSPGYHVFESFGITDLFQTDLANNLNYFLALNKNSVNTVCIVADRAVRLANFLPTVYQLKPSIKIYLLLQKNEMNPFIKKRGSKYEEIIEPQESRRSQIQMIKNNFKVRAPKFIDKKSDESNWFEKNVRMIFLPYSKHNHHMTLFLGHDDSFNPTTDAHKIERAVYYYKRGLSPLVDPVSLKEDVNKSFALQKFIELSHLAFKELPKMNSDALDSWIPFEGINWSES